MIVGVGIDVVDIARFQATLERTPAWWSGCSPRASEELKIASLAARFAAKEALAKALGAPGDLTGRTPRCATRRPGGRCCRSPDHRGARRRAGRHRMAPVADTTAGIASAVVIVES